MKKMKNEKACFKQPQSYNLVCCIAAIFLIGSKVSV